MRIEDILGETEVYARCPACNHSFQKKLKDLLRDGTLIKCPYCMVDIAIRIDSETDNEIGKINKALTNLEKGIKKLGGKIKLG